MNLIAIIPSGQTEITVNGLHQWDYGRKLEIHSNDISAGVLIEVHFACAGMDTAVVRVSNIVSGVATVTIPDKCLEQTTPVVAWVFEIDDTNKSGVTTKRINMPVEARPRPSVSEDIPQEVSDKYTEALTAINEAVADLKNGSIKVSNAVRADTATKATLDGNNQTITSTYAKKTDLTSGTITVAKAKSATQDGEGNTIPETYAKKTDLESGAVPTSKLKALYQHTVVFTFPWYSAQEYTAEAGRITYFLTVTAPDSTIDGAHLAKDILMSTGKQHIQGYRVKNGETPTVIQGFENTGTYYYTGFNYLYNGTWLSGPYFRITEVEAQVTTVQIY